MALQYLQLNQFYHQKLITEPKKGRYVFDFGENIVGFTHLQVEGKAAKEIELKFAEILTDKGLADQANSKGIKPTDKYILKGYGIEKWEPKFTYHGFRFVEVEGLPKKPDENTLLAKVIYSNVPFVENAAYSEEILNKILQFSIVFSIFTSVVVVFNLPIF